MITVYTNVNSEIMLQVYKSQRLRAGKGKMRNRRRIQRKGPLIVYHKDQVRQTLLQRFLIPFINIQTSIKNTIDIRSDINRKNGGVPFSSVVRHKKNYVLCFASDFIYIQRVWYMPYQAETYPC
jgi:hypothetical protein